MNRESFDDDKTRNHIVLAKGTMVSHYRIIEKIGAGGMGEVYLAEDTKLKRQVALKFLPPHLCQDEECRARFKREAQAAAKLNHPNIVTIHEVGEHQGRPFIAMEHVGGQSLKDHIQTKKLSLSQVIDYARQVCEGMHEAHIAGIVHRDIKPANIVFDSQNRPKLLDFGLAAGLTSQELTKTGSTLGTIGYMSPEQIQAKDVDARSDLFSLGVVLYEMIAGRRPFKGDNEAAVLNAVLNDSPEPLSRYKSEVSDDLQRIVTKLLRKDPALRYQTAADIVSDLKGLSTSKGGEPPKDWWNRYVVPAAVLVLVAMAAYWWLADDVVNTGGIGGRTMLAVLPFENLGDPEDEYFADGITDEITSRLALLTELRVISRTSAIQYKNTDKGIPQIAEELGVDYILEGTIRWNKRGDTNRVRIIPQLIRVSDNTHSWTDRYDAVIDDIFAVQSSIAEKVAEELDITLLEPERQALRKQLTENTEAYDYYLRGHKHFGNLTPKGYLNAEAMFLKATELEENFASAWGWLSVVHTQIYSWYIDRTEERLTAAKEAADRALEIAPDLENAQGALAWYHYAALEDHDRALEEFVILREKQPSYSLISFCIARIKRDQGNWEEAVVDYERALRLDPRSPTISLDYGNSLLYLRRYDEAESLFTRAIELKPDMQLPHQSRAMVYIHRDGDIKGAGRVLQDALQKTDRWPELTDLEAVISVMDGDYERALTLMNDVRDISDVSAHDSVYYYNFKGSVYRYMNQTDPMESCYDSARVILERIMLLDVDDPWNHAELGLTLAGLGRKQEAIQEGELAIESSSASESAIGRIGLIKKLARIYSIVGEYDRSIEQLDYLLSTPSTVSVPFLRLSPDFAPMRDHPLFQKLLDKYEDNNAYQ